jgi:hypothetical protein
MSATDRLIKSYLARLESELAGVPRSGRREVLDEIEAHVAEARAGLRRTTRPDAVGRLRRGAAAY